MARPYDRRATIPQARGLESIPDWRLLAGMRRIVLANETDWDGWRSATRRLVMGDVPPEDVSWSVGAPHADLDNLPDSGNGFGVSRALLALTGVAIQAREPDRFGLLYSLVRRANAGERPLDDPDDPEAGWARRLALSVRAESHRMRAHLRFLRVEGRFLGWYAPAHFILEPNARLISRRFPDDVFSIVTPDGSAHWDGASLRFGPGLREAIDDNTLRVWWDAHAEALLTDTWEGSSLPDADPLDDVPNPPGRSAIGPVVLSTRTDPRLAAAALDSATCQRCDLCRDATQTVFGEGPVDAPILFVGEQPGDREDVVGRPFVGPAGQLLDRAMEEAGIDRRAVYVTNAVKHFRFESSGPRRIHRTPDATHIDACGVWLRTERTCVNPVVTVLLGASAARAVLGRPVTVTRERGTPLTLPDRGPALVTVHPSYLLRIPAGAAQDNAYADFVRDLTQARRLAEDGATRRSAAIR